MFKILHYIIAIYEEKSFTKAAQKLYLSQPSLSLTIKKFEESIGTQIFDRSTSPLSLTEEGKFFLDRFQQIIEIENTMNNFIDDYNGLQTGSLTIGAPYLFSNFLLPKLIAQFKTLYPKIQVTLVEESSLKLQDDLIRGRLDLVIDSMDFDEELFFQDVLFKENILLAVPSSFSINSFYAEQAFTHDQIIKNELPSSKKEELSIGKFSDLDFILLEKGHDMNKRAVSLFEKNNVTPRVIMQQRQLMTIYNLVNHQLACSFISDTIVKISKQPVDILFYKIDSSISHRAVHIAYKKNKYITVSMKAFMKLAKKTLDLDIATK